MQVPKINIKEKKGDLSPLQPRSCRSEAQVLEIENIEDDEEKEKLLQMGIKCVTPGLPKEKLDEETKQEVEIVVNDQNDIIKERNRRSITRTESVEDDDEDLYDKYSSSDEIEEISDNEMNEKRTRPDLKYSNKKSEAKAQVFSSQQLPNEGTRPNKALKTTANATPQGESKNRVILKYMGYNSNGFSNPQTMSPEYAQYIAMYQQQQQLNMQRQKQIQYVQANAQMMHPFYMNNMMMNPVYASQMQYNQAYLSATKEESKPHRNGNSKRKLEEEVQGQQIKKTSSYTSNGANTESTSSNSETNPSSLCFNGVIQINNDSFRYEFETLKSQTVGKLPIEINEINKRKFMKICEKSWDESRWLINKREQYSGNTPTELNSALDEQQRNEKDKTKDQDKETEFQKLKKKKEILTEEE